MAPAAFIALVEQKVDPSSCMLVLQCSIHANLHLHKPEVSTVLPNSYKTTQRTRKKKTLVKNLE